MTRTFAWTAAGCLLLAGCSESTSTMTPSSAGTESAADFSAAEESAEGTATTTPAGVEETAASGVTKLSPENTKIVFVGTHAKGEPNPRIGNFEKFAGEIKSNGETIDSITAEIETASLKAEVGDKLTNHLKNEDFLDVRTYPTITFKSTKIEKQSGGEYSVTGDLTLHGTTKSITFPATATVGEQGVNLKSEFTIDRTEYGMDRLVENVEKEVKITVTVGEVTADTAGEG